MNTLLSKPKKIAPRFIATNSLHGIATRSDGRAVHTTVEGGYKVENFVDERFKDVNGKNVEKTPVTHPKSFDTYVVWREMLPAKFSKKFVEIDSRTLLADLTKFNQLASERFKTTRLWDGRTAYEIENFLTLFFDYKYVGVYMIQKGMDQTTHDPYWIFSAVIKKKSPARMTVAKHEEEIRALDLKYRILLEDMEVTLNLATSAKDYFKTVKGIYADILENVKTEVRYAHNNARAGNVDAAAKHLQEVRRLLRDE